MNFSPQHVRQMDELDITFSWCWCSIMWFMHSWVKKIRCHGSTSCHIVKNSSLLENLGKSYFLSMLWLRSTASTIASQVSFATYDCGYSFSVDSFQRLAIMAPLRVWLSVAPIMDFCQKLTTMILLLASSQEFMTTTLLLAFATNTHISWVSSLLALSIGIFRWSLLRLLLHGWLVIAKGQQLLI